MSKAIVTIAGSPSANSRSAGLLAYAANWLSAANDVRVAQLSLRELPADALLHAHAKNGAIAGYIEQVAVADAVLLATPIYKAAYSGLLKAFLDLLPQDGLKDKIVLPIATGGSAAHMLAIDYALKPVLSALGASHVLPGVYATDPQISTSAPGTWVLDEILETRLTMGLDQLAAALERQSSRYTSAPRSARLRTGATAALERC